MAIIPAMPQPQPREGSVFCTDPKCKFCKDLREVQRDLRPPFDGDQVEY